MQWLFKILFTIEKRVYIPYDDKFQRRLFGFLAERLFNIYIAHNKFRVKETLQLELKGVSTAASEENSRPKSIVTDDKLRDTLRQTLRFFGRKRPIFLGDKNYSPQVCRLFALNANDYEIVGEKGTISMKAIRERKRPDALHIFFVAPYEQVKQRLIQEGWHEGEDFVDGRKFLLLE